MNNFNPLTQCIFDGLLNAFYNHKKIGEEGKLNNKKNRFGDMAIRADVEAEEIILKSLSDYSQINKLNLIYKGEEMGEGKIENGSKDLFAVFDGLDGSSNYLNKNDFGYGTMVAVSDVNDPKYEEFIVAGLAMMEEGKIVIAVKNDGVYIYDVATNNNEKLDNFKGDDEFDDSKVLANKYFPEEISAYGDKPWTMTGSTAWSIFSICTDDRFNGLIEVTRKGNLEQPILYLMTTTLGGLMTDKDGNSIGACDFNSWGQKDKLLLITTKGKNITDEIIKNVVKN